MSDLKKMVIDGIISREGLYSNDASDSGGETMYGITKHTARAYGYNGDMKDLSRDLAFKIYSSEYWDSLNLDAIEKLSFTVADEIADTGVNMGISRAAKFLQRSLNVLNNKTYYYPDMKVDGQIGKVTLRALKSYFRIRGLEGEKVLLSMLNSLQGAYYVTLAERREKDEKFIYGWYRNRVE